MTKQLTKAFSAAVVAVVAFGMFAMPAAALTTAELTALLSGLGLSSSQVSVIAALLADDSSSGSGSSTTVSSGYTHTVTLKQGSSGSQVVSLQNALNFCWSTGLVADGAFGPATKAAVMTAQAEKGLVVDGVVGPNTGAAFATCMVAGTPGAGTGSTGSTGSTGNMLSGGAGSVDSYTLISSLNNEEVGEDEEDVEVAGLEVENSDESDLLIRAVKVVFAQSTGATNDDFEDYASEVSIWLDGAEVGRVDADEFTEDNSYTKTISLDSDAIIESGETADLVVAVSGASNLDTNDQGDAWTVDFTSVRWEDAQGTVISEDPATATRSFTFESFATATDVELKISKDDEDVNDSHIINVDATDETSKESILSFSIEIEGDSDVNLDELPFELTLTGMNIDDAVPTVYLYADGDLIGTENTTATDTDETITFDDLDYDIDAGDKVDFLIKADINDLDATAGAEVADGDGIQAQITSTERDLIDADDESGEALATTDMTGTAVGDTHYIFDVGFNLELVSVSSVKSFESETSGTGDQAQFVIKYNITAFDGDIYIDNTCTEDNDGSEVSTTTSYSITNNGSNTTSCVMTASGTDSDATDSANTFLVDEDDTRTFTLTVNATASADAFAAVSLEAIGWDNAAGGDDNVFDYDLPGEFETDPIYLNLF